LCRRVSVSKLKGETLRVSKGIGQDI